MGGENRSVGPTMRRIQRRNYERSLFGEPSLAAGNNGDACWVRGIVSPLDQKSPTGWLACLYGGPQTGDDWARLNIPVDELKVTDFDEAEWSHYLTNAESMGVNMVVWIHDPADFSKRADVSQVGGKVARAQGWNVHVFDPSVTQMFYYGENTTGTALVAGTQYSWDQFQADVLFSTWTIYRITLEWGWEASGTFEEAYVADVRLGNVPIQLKPDSGGSGRFMIRRATATSGALALTLAPKTPFKNLVVSLHLSAVETTSTQNFTVNVDAGVGSAYDENLLTIDTVGNAILDLEVEARRPFLADDEIDIALANTDNKTYGATISAEVV